MAPNAGMRLPAPQTGQPAPNVSLPLTGDPVGAQPGTQAQNQQTAANNLQQSLNMVQFSIGGNGETPNQTGIVSIFL